MTIYLFNEQCKSKIDFVQKNMLPNIDRSYKIESEKNIELLLNKELFLIDIFNTFIQPIVTIEDDITLERGGMIEFMKLREPRLGFNEFIEYYYTCGKKIGIHSDAIYKKDFEVIRKMWKFDQYLTRYFDPRYVQKVDIFKGLDERNYVKDFDEMIRESNISKEKTLIIGDGLGDIIPAKAFNIDLLLVPTFNVDLNFDYRCLIPKK